MTDKVTVYKTLEDYANDKPIVEILGVDRIVQSHGYGFVFYIGEQEHYLPANTIFISIPEE